ncbi:MAG: hypothetical protein KQ78_01207 [Candidatus Izimaplasma bacterium HR2]|nr:MAG: hypothetical protein KQ78_01207 [Candidatus Izimaplasma bacterium HR2]
MSPRCVKCENFFHPDWCVVIDETTNACKCVFCYTEKNEITIESEDGSPEYKVTKTQAAENYKRYVQDLKESEKIQKIMMKGQENPFAK